MFQKQDYSLNNEESFNELFELFKNYILKETFLKQYNDQWDINKIYKINHACIWNCSNSIGKECKIIEKNEYIAVIDIEDYKDILRRIYRLEDLTPKF